MKAAVEGEVSVRVLGQKRRYARKIAGAAVVAVMASGLVACSSQSTSDENVLQVTLANHPWTDYITERFSEFEEAHDVKIEYTVQTANQTSQSYGVKLNAGATDLDVMMYRPLQEGLQFARNGWLLRLDDELSADSDYNWDDFTDSAVDTVTYEDAAYGVPLVTEREVLFYRTDLFEEAGLEPPTTMEELESAAKTLTDPDQGVFGFAARGLKADAVTQFSGLLYSHGGDFVVDDKAALNTPEAVAAYQEYGDLLRNYGPVGVESMTTEQIIPLFQQGGIAMWLDAEPFYPTLTDEKASKVADNVGVAPLPAGPEGSRPYSVASWGLAINKKSTKSDLALDFVKWATGPEMTKDVQERGILGARDSVWDDDEVMSTLPKDFADTLRVSLENGVGHDRPVVVQVGRARDIVGEPIVTAIQGGDVQAAADKAQAAFEKFLKEDATASTAE